MSIVIIAVLLHIYLFATHSIFKVDSKSEIHFRDVPILLVLAALPNFGGIAISKKLSNFANTADTSRS